MIYQAHRGVRTEYPENTMPAFEAAIRQGYGVIELDVSVTKDGRFVLLHDATINRMARLQDGSELEETVNISDITYEQALDYDFGLRLSLEFKGKKIALFEDVLCLAKKNNIKLKIDNKYQKFTSGQRKAFFELLKPYEDIVSLTCFDTDELKKVTGIFPSMHFHYDGPVNDAVLEEIGTLLPKEQLTVWLPIECPKTSWVKVAFADEKLSKTIKKYAKLGLWIISNAGELAMAEKLGADIIETNGEVKP